MRNKDEQAIAPRTQTLRIIAQDPAIRVNGKILTADVDIPAEILGLGPWGHRVQVVDYDTSTNTLYAPYKYEIGDDGIVDDPFANANDDRLLAHAQFHAQNAYAIVMRILARFEMALGRRVSWSFGGHQIKVAPHAFADANAFYSKQDEALMFGYFPGEDGRTILSCLSHDVIAHETTHALLDGLRDRYTDPSSPDQAGFHEGYSDIIALLSVFALPEVVKALLDLQWVGENSKGRKQSLDQRVDQSHVEKNALKRSVLMGMAKEMGQALSLVRGQPLRHSLELSVVPNHYLKDTDFLEPHRRGEILVAAVMHAFIDVWSERLKELRRDQSLRLDRDRVAEEGANAADCLLTMCIRALDFCPPVHLTFGDFLSALLTADYEMRPLDRKFQLRSRLRDTFQAFGIKPASTWSQPEPGMWKPAEVEAKEPAFSFARSHFEPMQRDSEEVFRFIWENRKPLNLADEAFTRVQSVRPCTRLGDDGFLLRETVAEYIQILKLEAGELQRFGVEKPAKMPADKEVMLYGGGVLIFDEYGRIKFHIHNSLKNKQRQSDRLAYLFEYGHFSDGASFERRFSRLHRMRAMNATRRPQEGWL